MIVYICMVFLGSGLGGVCRWALSSWLNGQHPYGTLICNLLGCFLLGLLTKLSPGDTQMKLLLTTIANKAFSWRYADETIANYWFLWRLHHVLYIHERKSVHASRRTINLGSCLYGSKSCFRTRLCLVRLQHREMTNC